MKSVVASLRQNRAAASSPRKATITLGLVFLIFLCIFAYVRILEYMLAKLPVLETQSFPSNVVDASDEAGPGHEISSPRIRNLVSRAESAWKGGDVVHVVYSRFMQRQAKLVELGLARAELFRVFCLPTMVQQTNPNFLWIIRTDPKLDKKVLSIMVEMLEPHPNFLLVASNGNNEGWRSASAMSDVLTPKNILVGNATLAKEFHDASQTRTVLETRLDADDGLHLEYVDLLQRSSQQHFAPSIPSPAAIGDPVGIEPKNQSRWLYWCVNSHVEWYPHGSDVDETTTASGGILKGAKERFCATPGLTKGYAAGTKHSDIPSMPHHRLHKRVKECKDEHDTQCLRRIKELFPPALRARTSTSAGMKGVKANNEDSSNVSYRAEKWAMVRTKFGITEDDARKTSSYLRDHQGKIAADNLKGQCTKGHSCKQSSKEVLLKMIESAENLKKEPHLLQKEGK